MTWFIVTGMGPIVNSDWTGNTWVLTLSTLFSSVEMDPFLVLIFLAIFLFPRLLFAAAASLYDAGRFGKDYVYASAFPVIVVTAWLALQLMTASNMLGPAPGVIVIIGAPVVDSRLILPTPPLLGLGYFIIRSRG